MCRTGVGRSSIRCSKCNLWVHYKKCSGLKTLSEDLSYECPRCRGVPGVCPVDGRPFKEVEVGDCVLEAVDRFCYLGDMLSAGGGCMAAATARCRCAWGKFRENLPLLICSLQILGLAGRKHDQKLLSLSLVLSSKICYSRQLSLYSLLCFSLLTFFCLFIVVMWLFLSVGN